MWDAYCLSCKVLCRHFESAMNGLEWLALHMAYRGCQDGFIRHGLSLRVVEVVANHKAHKVPADAQADAWKRQTH